MDIHNLSEDNLKELFALFTSCSSFERGQIYTEDGNHDYRRECLDDEYELVEEKREYALDSWRAVLYFLYRHGYKLSKGGEVIGLDFIEREFAE